MILTPKRHRFPSTTKIKGKQARYLIALSQEEARYDL